MAQMSAKCYTGHKLRCNGKEIGNLVPRKVDGVIRFSWTQQISSTKIRRQLIVVYIDGILACHQVAQIFRKCSGGISDCERGRM